MLELLDLLFGFTPNSGNVVIHAPAKQVAAPDRNADALHPFPQLRDRGCRHRRHGIRHSPACRQGSAMLEDAKLRRDVIAIAVTSYRNEADLALRQSLGRRSELG
jgi:hypothetical protein